MRAQDAGRRARCGNCGQVFAVELPDAAAESERAVATAGAVAMALAPAPELITFECSLCQTRITARTVDMGRIAACPDCGRKNVVPPPQKAKAPVAPPAMQGEQYEVWGVDEAPRQFPTAAKLIPVDCRVCQTLMYAPADRVGREIKCPDCGAMTKVLPRRSAKPTGPALVADGEEYQVDETAPPEARPFAMPISVRDAELHTSARATTVGPDGRLIVQKLPEHQRRPVRPAVPLVQGAWRMLVTEEIIARWVLLSILFGAAGWLFHDSINTPIGGVTAIGAIFLMLMAVGVTVLWLTVAGPLFLAIVAESTDGQDRLQEPPQWTAFDWFVESFYFITAAAAAGLPALGAWRAAAAFSEPARAALAAGVVLLIFPLALLGAMLEGTPMGVISPRLMMTLGRCAGPWLLFYVLLAGVWALAAAGAWGAVQADEMGVIALPFLAMAAMIASMRLLGRLGWWIGDVAPGAEDGDKNVG